MSLLFAMHSRPASHCLRAVALLAWLMLAVSFPQPAMTTASASVQDAAGMASGMKMVAQHTAREHCHAGHCCGEASQAHCHCHALCGSVLPAAIPAWFGPIALAAMIMPMRGADAPMFQPLPPLRPPAAR
ncbi:hypothetical protein ISP15_10335 [Dyella jejuensis]|uniref:DUF2946 domain-containing protein n=1 Tax=Dyella jejuensis TaxID=1432009 RepID=A0ABW8JI36_9GAMM